MKYRKITALALATASLAWIGAYYATGRQDATALTLGALAALTGLTIIQRRPNHHH